MCGRSRSVVSALCVRTFGFLWRLRPLGIVSMLAGREHRRIIPSTGWKTSTTIQKSSVFISSLRLSHRSDLRHTHRLGHAVENYNALAAAARRQRLGRLAIASVYVLPVVRHPNVAGRIDVDIDLHL